MFSKDIELATDEKVIHHLNHDEIKGYSETLLACSLIKSNLMIKTCPVAFGEIGVKDRIKAVLSYKKPSFWIILIAIISCIVVAVCFLTKQKDDKIDAFTQDIDEVLKKENDVSNQVPISQFQNIMGYDTYYIDTENAPHFYTRDYYTKYDGKVTKAEFSSAYGYHIVIEHTDGYETVYAHLQEIKVDVGDSIKNGDEIGTVVATGMATGPHLHLELHDHGEAVNPLNYIKE